MVTSRLLSKATAHDAECNVHIGTIVGPFASMSTGNPRRRAVRAADELQ
jgi:hypothetical protein